MNKKVIFLASLGVGLEYYDFIVYGVMAAYLSQIFFVADNLTLSVLKTFSVFAVGYLFRPIGGTIAGMIADKYGRKTTFLAVMLLMAFSTLCIGLLPTYAQVGVMAPILLIVLRAIQGLSFGAEMPGALTIIKEHNKSRLGLSCSLVIGSTSIGALLATLVVFGLSSFFSHQAILDGFWRLPFLVGGMLAIVSFFIRRHLEETPEFMQQKVVNQTITTPLKVTLKEHLNKVGMAIGLLSLPASLILTNIFFPTFFSNYFSYKLPDIYLASALSLVVSVITFPFFGLIADKIQARNLFMITAVIVLGFNLINQYWLPNGSFISLTLLMIIYQLLLSATTASGFSLLATLFPTSIRYTAIAFSYGITFGLCGLLPSLMMYLIEHTQHTYAAFYPTSFTAIVALLVVYKWVGINKTQDNQINLLSVPIKH